jgi:hypothetical protein
MRVLWRLDLDVPPPVIWPPAVFGVAACLQAVAMLWALDDLTGTPAAHDAVPLICAAVIGLISSVRQRGRLLSHSFSPWHAATSTAVC